MTQVRYQRNPNFIFRKIVDESILVPLHKNVVDMECIYTLNSVGVFIWEQLEQPITKDDLQVALLKNYDAEPDVLSADLEHFIGDLTSIGALQEVEL